MSEIQKMSQKKKNFYISDTLDHRVNTVLPVLGVNFSELIRRALNDYLDKIEKERVDTEAIEAIKFYAEIDKQIASEWRAAEATIK